MLGRNQEGVHPTGLSAWGSRVNRRSVSGLVWRDAEDFWVQGQTAGISMALVPGWESIFSPTGMFPAQGHAVRDSLVLGSEPRLLCL